MPRGLIILLDETYQISGNISTDPLPDLHEFQVADGGQSALVAVKRYTQSALGTTMGTWVMDGCVRCIFTFVEHVNFADSLVRIFSVPRGAIPQLQWLFSHRS